MGEILVFSTALVASVIAPCVKSSDFVRGWFLKRNVSAGCRAAELQEPRQLGTRLLLARAKTKQKMAVRQEERHQMGRRW